MGEPMFTEKRLEGMTEHTREAAERVTAGMTREVHGLHLLEQRADPHLPALRAGDGRAGVSAAYVSGAYPAGGPREGYAYRQL